MFEKHKTNYTKILLIIIKISNFIAIHYFFK